MDKFMQAAKDKDCESMVDLMDIFAAGGVLSRDESGEDSTESDTFTLIQKAGEWKIVMGSWIVLAQ